MRQKKNIPTTQSAAPFVDSVQEPTKPSELGGVTPQQPAWVDPNLKLKSQSDSSTSESGSFISVLSPKDKTTSDGMTGGKYDLSQVKDPSIDKRSAEQVAYEFSKEIKKPTNVKLAESKMKEVDSKIVDVSREWYQTEDAVKKQAELYQSLISQYQDQNIDDQTKAAVGEQIMAMQEQNKELLSRYESAQKKAIGLQKAKSALNKVSEVYDELSMVENDDALKMTGLFLDKAYNAITGVVGGLGAIIKSIGDVAAPIPTNHLEGLADKIETEQGKVAANAFRKKNGIGSQSFTDILGDGLIDASNFIKADVNEKYADKHYVVSTLGQIAGSVAAVAIPGIGAASKIPSVVSGAMLGADQVYSTAEQAGLSDVDAGKMTLTLAPILGLINSWGASGIIDAAVGKAFVKEVVSNSIKELAGKTVSKEVLTSVLSTSIKDLGKKYGAAMLKSSAEEGLSEGLEAEVTSAAENIYDKINGEEKYHTDFFSAETQKNAALNAALGAATGSLFGGLGALSGDVKNKRFTSGQYEQIKAVTSSPDMMKKFADMLKTEVDAKHITQEQADNIANNVDAISKLDSVIPETIKSTQKRMDAISLLRERAELEKEIEGRDKFVSAPQNERIKEINQSLEAIAKGKSTIEVKDEKTGEIIKKPVIEKGFEYNMTTDKAGNKYYTKTDKWSGEEIFITEEEYNKNKGITVESKPKEVSAEPKEGDSVELPLQIEGASPRKMVFIKDGWMQDVGGETTRVSEKLQEQAASKFVETAPKVTTETKVEDSVPAVDEGKQNTESAPPTPEQGVADDKVQNTEPVVSQEKKPIEGEEKKTHAIWDRVLGNSGDEELNKGIKAEGVEYVVKKQSITEDEARKVLDGAIETDTVSDLEKVILDDKNKMDRTTRGVLSAMVGKHYFDLMKDAEDFETKSKYSKLHNRYIRRAAELATEGGQQGSLIGKAIKKLYAKDEDFLIKSFEDKMNEMNEAALEPHKQAIKSTYEQIQAILKTPEGEKAISEEINKRAEGLFGKETQTKINNFFDGLKIDTKGKAMSSIVPPQLYNGAVEAMKQAALLGAKGASIIEAGVKYIKANLKEEFDEKAFREDMEAKLKASGVKFGKKAKAPKKVVTPKQIKSILDAIEQKANRLKPENRKKFLADVVQEVEQEGGLSEDRFTEMYSEALGLPTMNEELSKKLSEYAKIINEGEKAEAKYKGLLKKMSEARKVEDASALSTLESEKKATLSEMNKAVLKAKKANEELEILFKGNKKFSDSVIGMMQLGALTPGSIIKNISGMPIELAIRALSARVETPIHYVLKGLAKVGVLNEKWGEKTSDPQARAVGAFLAHPKAARKFYEALIHGSLGEDYNVRENKNSITPIRAAQNILSGKTKGDRSAFAANLLEALPQGYMAAFMGRALAGPDAFFRAVAESAKAFELGTMKGLKNEDLELFMLEPDAESLQKIKMAGDEVTFQQDNIVTSMISGAKQGAKRFVEKNNIGGNVKKSPLMSVAKVVAKSQMLYVKTPTNVFGRVLKTIMPEISVGEAVIAAKKGDVEKFTRKLSEAAVGYAFRGVAYSLISAGHVEPPLEDKDEKLNLQNDPDTKHAGKMNYSAILRKFAFQDETHKDTDIWVDYMQWLGSGGIALGAYAQLYKDTPKDEMKSKSILAPTNAYQMLPAAARSVMDLSFMQATGELMDALRDDNKAVKWGATTVGTLLTPLVPNTLGNVSKGVEDTKKEVRDKNFINRVTNDFKYKLFMGDQLPSKINIWGEEVKTTPEGKGLAYYLFNVVKPENPDENSIGYKIAELYDKTKDKRVVPELPANEITIRKVKVPLTAEETELLQKFVGKQREVLATAYIKAGDFSKDNDDDRAQKLSKIYADGKKAGTKMFIEASERIKGIDSKIPAVESSSASLKGGKIEKPKKPEKPKKNKF